MANQVTDRVTVGLPWSELPGEAGEIVSATATGLPPGSEPTVTLGGTPSERTIEFGIPVGDPGPPGDGSVNSVNGDLGPDVVLNAEDVGAISTINGHSGPDVVLDADDVGAEHKFLINVMDYGATGDGSTDDAGSVQAAANEAGGKVLYFPPGEYRMGPMVHLPERVVLWGQNAKIIKDSNTLPDRYVAFTALGGSGWYNDVTIDNLDFEGNLSNGVGVMVLWAHRARNVQIRNIVVTDAVHTSHCVDLQGCDGVLIENSTFSGASNATPDRQFTECIQIDASMWNGAPAGGEPGQVYDGTVTKNVIVRGCRFVRQGSYFAPRAIGSHSSIANRYYENILVEGNYFETPIINTKEDSYYSVLNFCSTRDCVVRNNEFNLLAGREYPAHVEFHEVLTWRTASQAASDTTRVPATDPMWGTGNSAYGNKYSPSYEPAIRDYVVPDFQQGFEGWSESDEPRIYERDGQLTLVGIFRCPSPLPPDIGANSGEVMAHIPDELTPERQVRSLCQGSGNNNQWLCNVGADSSGQGVIIVSRYSAGATGNPYLCADATWPKR